MVELAVFKRDKISSLLLRRFFQLQCQRDSKR